MVRRNEKSIVKNTNVFISQLRQPCNMKYIVVVIDRGMTSEVSYFDSLKEAKRAFGKIARNHRYRPSEINGSDYYHVSIWKWIGDRFEDINYCP
jgi:hypothetical protein